MHNWWIAALEHFGLITREEAEHIAKEIKTSIHKDNYAEAYRELDAILGSARFSTASRFKQLSEQVDLHTQQIDKLNKNVAVQTGEASTDSKKQPAKVVANNTKA